MSIKHYLIGLLGLATGCQVYFVRYELKDMMDDFLLLEKSRWNILGSLLFTFLSILGIFII